jgi:hypothetical protein
VEERKNPPFRGWVFFWFNGVNRKGGKKDSDYRKNKHEKIGRDSSDVKV